MTPRIILPAVALVGLALGACGGSAHVSTPSDAASPEDVVRAYVAAVNAKDCATARTLAADADLWCGKSTLSDLQITGTTDQTRDGKPADTVKDVSVTFTLHGGDASMPEGHHSWGYLLDRTGPHGAWRIYSQGVG